MTLGELLPCFSGPSFIDGDGDSSLPALLLRVCETADENALGMCSWDILFSPPPPGHSSPPHSRAERQDGLGDLEGSEM